MTLEEKLERRLNLLSEREAIAKQWLDQGAIILTKKEAEEILRRLKLCNARCQALSRS